MLIAGTDSALITGRKAQLQAWKREFAARPRTIYTRTPDRIEASPILPLALEHGHWTGVAETGETLASGSYTAKWRNIGDRWVIEGELYLTLS